MEEQLVSVIIPAYNAERYIKKSLMSVLDSTYKRIEVIVIDDGSTDGTVDVVRGIDDKRLRIVKNNWGGVSVARNTGIDLATGQYLCFVDADDRVAPDMIAELLIYANNYSADVVICNHYNETVNNVDIASNIEDDILIFEGEKLLQYQRMFMLKNYNPYEPYFPIGQPWGTLYSTDVIKKNHIKFVEGMQYKEDVIFNMHVAHYSKKIVRINKPLYYYNNSNKASLTTSGLKEGMLPRIELDLKERIKVRDDYFKDDELFNKGLNQHIVRTFYRNIVPSCIKDSDYADCRRYLNEEYIKTAFEEIDTSLLSNTERIIVWILKHNGLLIYYHALKLIKRA